MRDSKRHRSLLHTIVHIIHELLLGLGSCAARVWDLIRYHRVQELVEPVMAVKSVVYLFPKVQVSRLRYSGRLR